MPNIDVLLVFSHECEHQIIAYRADGGLAPTEGNDDGIVGGPRTPQQIAAQKRLQQTQAQVDEVCAPWPIYNYAFKCHLLAHTRSLCCVGTPTISSIYVKYRRNLLQYTYMPFIQWNF